MVEISRDGRRVYFSNSLYASWDAQFYPAGIQGWAAKIDIEQEKICFRHSAPSLSHPRLSCVRGALANSLCRLSEMPFR